MISKNTVVTKIVKFRSLLLILKQITSVFAILINLFIWHFYSLPYYCIQFPIGRYASKTHMHICFEENDTKVCFYNYESCHKINTLRLFYHALVATVYEWLIQIGSCSLAVLWSEPAIFGDDVLILLIFCVMFYRSLFVLLSQCIVWSFSDSGYPVVIFKLFFVPNSVLYPQNNILLTHNQMPQY